MNLNNIVSGTIAAVNPQVSLSIQVSIGNTVGSAGKQVPVYASVVTVPGQIQPLTWRDLQQLDGLNLTGRRVKIYINGQVNGLVRSENKGGDLITVATGPYAGVWLVAQVLEGFDSAGWCSVAATLQDGS